MRSNRGACSEGGKTYAYFGGAKALFSYLKLQVTGSVGWQNNANFLIMGANPPCAPCRYVPGEVPLNIGAFLDKNNVYKNIKTQNP